MHRYVAVAAASIAAFTLGLLARDIAPTAAKVAEPKFAIIHAKDTLDGTLPQVIPGVWVKSLYQTSAADVSVVQISSVKPHTHNGSSEYVYVVEGSANSMIAGKAATVKAGDLIVIPKGTPHSFTATGGKIKLLAFALPPLAANDIHFLK